MGSSKMESLARSYIFYPGMGKDIENAVATCVNCQEQAKRAPTAPTHAWSYPNKPFERVHMDMLGPMSGKNILVLVDAFSKFPFAKIMSSSNSRAVITMIDDIFAEHGYPVTIVTDNGTNFTSSEIENYFINNKIRHIRTAPF